MGGFDFVMKCLMMEDGDTKKHSPHGNDNESSMMAVAYEAAGCLAQLSNPSHPFVRPPRPAGPLVQRLLQACFLNYYFVCQFLSINQRKMNKLMS
jgi:hypothetical protein